MAPPQKASGYARSTCCPRWSAASGSTAQVSCGGRGGWGKSQRLACRPSGLLSVPIGAHEGSIAAAAGLSRLQVLLSSLGRLGLQPLLYWDEGDVEAKGALNLAWQQPTMTLGGRCSCRLCELALHCSSSMALEGRAAANPVDCAPTTRRLSVASGLQRATAERSWQHTLNMLLAPCPCLYSAQP